MKPGAFLSLKDYFNYYISGLLWCMAFLFFTGNSLSTFVSLILSTKTEASGMVIIGLLIIFIPYLVGFVLLQLGEWVRELWQGGKERNRFPDPRKYLLQYEVPDKDKISKDDEKRIKKIKGVRFSLKETGKIAEIAYRIFGYQHTKTVHLYFYPIRAYVLEYGGASARLVDRARDLANFTESLLLPLPVMIIGLSFFLFWGKWLWLALCIFIAMGVHLVLVYRYFELEKYWVKHVYRTFLAITSKSDLK